MSNLSLLPAAAARVIVVEEVVVVAQVAEAEASAWGRGGRGHVCKWKEEEKTVLPRPVVEEGEAGKRREIDPPLLYEIFAHYLFCLPPLSPTYMTGG